MNIYQKLHEIYKQVGYIQKGKQGKQYDYVGSSDVLANIRALMADQGLQLEPRILKGSTKDYATKSGTTQILTELDMTMTWVNVENPDEKIELPWYSQGMDLAGEKGVGKALTYGEKYFLLKYFNIATDKDDPDAFQDKVDANKPKKKITKNQLTEVENLVKEYVALKDLDAEGNNKLIAFILDRYKLEQFEDAYEDTANKLIRYLKDQIKKAQLDEV